MSGVSAGNKPDRPQPAHKTVVAFARDMRKLLAAVVTTWNVKATVHEVTQEIVHDSEPLPGSLHIVQPDGSVTRPGDSYQWVERTYTRRRRRPAEFPQADAHNWNDLWKLAVHMRDQADRLAVYAAQQGRLARQQAHPANHETEE